MNSPHIPVLLQDILQIFSGIQTGIIIDCTLGFGGHTKALLEQNPHIKVIGIDRDADARDFSTKLLAPFGERFQCIAGSFGEIFPQVLEKYSSEIRGVLADIGVSSYQIDTLERGFSFKGQKLDMRMDQNNTIDAQKILMYYSSFELERVFREYGELKEAKKLAHLIVDFRDKNLFQNAQVFNHWLKTNFKNPKILPLVYQALRIEVNQELNELDLLLDTAKLLKNAILCIITFHSLEDRRVKNTFKNFSKSCICPSHIMRCECGNQHSLGEILIKRPIIATAQEIKENSRSASAKLRAFYFK